MGYMLYDMTMRKKECHPVPERKEDVTYETHASKYGLPIDVMPPTASGLAYMKEYEAKMSELLTTGKSDLAAEKRGGVLRIELIGIAARFRSDTEALTGTYSVGRVVKEGDGIVNVVLTGVPNSGKSTLFNALIGDNKSEVSDIPGTTFSPVEATIEFCGLRLRFTDTAGLSGTADPIYADSIRLAADAVAHAAVVLRTVDCANGINPFEQLSCQRKMAPNSDLTPEVLVITKTDRIRSVTEMFLLGIEEGTLKERQSVSALKGEGINELRYLIKNLIIGPVVKAGNIILTDPRHYEALCDVSGALNAIICGIDLGWSADRLAPYVDSVSKNLSAVLQDCSE